MEAPSLTSAQTHAHARHSARYHSFPGEQTCRKMMHFSKYMATYVQPTSRETPHLPPLERSHRVPLSRAPLGLGARGPAGAPP